MLTRVIAAKCIGINAVDVVVEIDIDRGIGIHLVGLADAAVKESLLRTTTALETIGYRIPGKKIVINLAPADLRKNGGGYDLPIAVGIIAASGQRELPGVGKYIIMGELGLDASVRSVPGALPYAELARNNSMKGIILPKESAREASLISGVEIYGVSNLEDVVRILEEREDVSDLMLECFPFDRLPFECGAAVDMSEIVGQECAKRGLEIAAAGGHNLIFVGAPGSGKSSLAKALAGILPPMDEDEFLLTNKIYSIAGRKMSVEAFSRRRPFRAPHHSASMAAIIGGGAGENILPGEVSLATGGVLFLDEFTLFPRSVAEALRGPLEDRKVIISRLKSKVEFPAAFMMVAASNPCPCGYWGEGDRCVCSTSQRLNYLTRLSGPIIDRMDLHIKLYTVPPDRLLNNMRPESSAVVAERVYMARMRQKHRFAEESITLNSEMTTAMLEKYCQLSAGCKSIVGQIMERMQLSMRAYHRIIRVARTIADLDGADQITDAHLIEAASFRMLDRMPAK